MPWPTAEPGGTRTNSPCLRFKPKPQLWPDHGTVPTLAGVSSHLQGAVTVPTVTAGCTRALLPHPPLRCAGIRGNTNTVTQLGHTSSTGWELPLFLSSQPTCAANTLEPPQPHSNVSFLTYSGSALDVNNVKKTAKTS